MTNQPTPPIFDLAASVGAALQQRKLVLATAESCTGGGISQAVTEIAGSTSWFDCGFVVYSNASKTELLEVPDALIAQFGSVSEEVAAAMAQGALASSNASVALSTTGIAGPDRRRARQTGRHGLFRLGHQGRCPHRAPGVCGRPPGRARTIGAPRAAGLAAVYGVGVMGAATADPRFPVPATV